MYQNDSEYELTVLMVQWHLKNYNLLMNIIKNIKKWQDLYVCINTYIIYNKIYFIEYKFEELKDIICDVECVCDSMFYV